MDASKQISLALQINNTIYGFHFNGMPGFVDNLGFLTLNDKYVPVQNANIKRIKGCEIIQSSKLVVIFWKLFLNDFKYFIFIYKNYQEDENNTSVCWICDGWCIQDFNLSFDQETLQPYKDYEKYVSIFVHFQFEGYQPRYIGNAKFESYLDFQFIVPNKDFFYFFSIQNIPFITLTDSVQSFTHLQKVKIFFNNVPVDFSVRKMNFRPLDKENSMFYPDSYNLKVKTTND